MQVRFNLNFQPFLHFLLVLSVFVRKGPPKWIRRSPT